MKIKKLKSVFVSSMEELDQLYKSGLLLERKTVIQFKCEVCGIISTKKYRHDRNMILLCHKHATENTFLKKYGKHSHFLCKEMQDKAHATIHMHAEERKEKIQLEKLKIKREKEEKRLKKIIEEYGSIESYNIYNSLSSSIEKTRYREILNYGSHDIAQQVKIQHTIESNLKNYGIKWNSQLESVKEKIKNSNLAKYGVPCYTQTDEFKDKSKQQKLNRYGDSNYRNDKQIFETCLSVYGCISPFGNEKIRQKIAETNREKYGVDNPWKSKTIQDKCRQKYVFNNCMFDSAPEIAYYIWLSDNHINFEYQPPIKFEYQFNNINHFYMPDFRVGNELHEIKGDQFFDETGKMINPFRMKDWTDEEYFMECAKYEAKHQCMLINNVKILRSAEYSKFLDYVSNKYGKDYLSQFRSS